MGVKSVYPAQLAADVAAITGVTVNEETLAGNKTIADGDPQIQVLDPDGTNRDVTIPSAPTAGSWWEIANVNNMTAAIYLDVKVSGDSSAIVRLYPGHSAVVVYTANGWLMYGAGFSAKRTGVNTFESNTSTVLGYRARCVGANEIAIGNANTGGGNSIAVGNGASAAVVGGVAMGQNSTGGGTYFVALGYNTNAGGGSSVSIGNGAASAGSNAVACGAVSVASATDSASLGSYADAAAVGQVGLGRGSGGSTRYSALTKSTAYTNGTSLKNEEVSWFGSTTDATITEVFLAGAASNRFVLAASSLVGFKIQVLAREAATGDCKYWEVSGAIKRDGANNTALVGSVTKTVVGADAGASAWDVTVDADDTNEALRVQVTGEASHTISWGVNALIIDRR